MSASTLAPGGDTRRASLVMLAQFSLGMALVGGLGWLGLRLWPQPELPSGWQIIRPPRDVMALAVYQGELWSGGADGLYRIDLQSGLVTERISEPLDLRGVTSLAVEATGAAQALWIGHDQGVSRLSAGNWQHWEAADGLPDRQALALCITAAGQVWVGTPHGAAQLGAGGWEVFGREQGLAGEAVSVIYEDSRGWLWLGDGFTAQGGLSRVKLPVLPGAIAEDMGGYPAHPGVNAILQDPQGNIWFGVGFASQGGLTRFDGEIWRSWSVEDGLAGANTRSLIFDQAGALWAGSEYDGVARLWLDENRDLLALPDAPQRLTPKQGLAGWEIKIILVDSLTGALWLGTENGLSRLDSQAWQSVGRSVDP